MNGFKKIGKIAMLVAGFSIFAGQAAATTQGFCGGK